MTDKIEGEAPPPKRRRGPRGLVREYLIIVLGVATALAGEQAVQWLHQRGELAQARKALREEIVEGVTGVRNSLIEDRCLLGVAGKFEAWAKGGPKPRSPGVLFPYPGDTVWQSLSTGAVALMPQKEKLAYARYYFHAANNRALADTERDLGMTISGYQALGSLTRAEARQLLLEVDRTKSLLGAKLGSAPYLLKLAKDLNAEPEPMTPQTRAILAAECAEAGLPLLPVD